MMKEFTPIDKVPELTEMLQAYHPIIHQNSDEGYDWLDENSFCIEVPNPNTNESLTIEGADCGEFTVCYAYFHSHHFADEYGYSRMCERLSDLLNSKCGSAAIFCGSENKWMGSTTVEKEKISLPLEEIFDFIFEHKKFAEELRTNGGEARFVFWDSRLNKSIRF